MRPFRHPSRGVPEVVTFQTAPAMPRNQQAKEYPERRESRLSRPESNPLLDHHPSRSCSPPPLPAVATPPLKTLFTKPVIATVLNYALLASTEIFFTAILPVYLVSTPVSLTPGAIVLIGSLGIFNGIFQAVCTAALLIIYCIYCIIFLMPLECQWPSSSSRPCVNPTTPRVFIVCLPLSLRNRGSYPVTNYHDLQFRKSVVLIQRSQMARPKQMLQAILAVQIIQDGLHAQHHTKHHKVRNIELVHLSYWFASGTLLTGSLQISGSGKEREESMEINKDLEIVY